MNTPLPSPTPVYDRADQSGVRLVLGLELAQLAEETQALRDAQTVVVPLSSATSFTVPAPRLGPTTLVLDVSNTSAGAIVVTLATVFLGTFPAPAAGKRRTQMYWYDRGATKWIPAGAQSSDL